MENGTIEKRKNNAMNKKGMVTLAVIFLFLYSLNYLTPMSFGDDYLYSFLWQGESMDVPIGEQAARISSWKDLFISQRLHYFTWGGRTVAHVLVQFFLWMGKDVFNFFNAFIGIFLIAEIYWCINKGRISLDFNARKICWIFFVLWAFTPGFSTVFFWLTAACNYLWTSVILLAFLIPYIQKYYAFPKMVYDRPTLQFFMFFFGIVAGWTNENSVCFVILILIFFVYQNYEKGTMEQWMITGLTGLIIGYAFLMLAPGNAARFFSEHGDNGSWLNIDTFKKNFQMLLMIFYFQLFLWFFSIRAILTLKNLHLQNVEKRNIYLIKILCLLAFSMSAIMLFSPDFPPRSGSFGTIFLIIATGLLLNLQEKYNLELIRAKAKSLLFYVGVLYFCMTASVTVVTFYKVHTNISNLLYCVEQTRNNLKDNVLQVKEFKNISEKAEILSGFHILGFELSENESDWKNVAFARYYGIKGIRMVKEKNDNKKTEHK